MLLPLGVFLFVAVASTLQLARKNRRLSRAAQAAEAQALQAQRALALANATLETYRPVLDAQQHAAKVLRDAESAIARQRNEAEQLVATVYARTREQLRDAEERLASADKQAADVIAEAQRRAEEISGDALRARAEAGQLELTLRALRNAVDGYGDRYLAPSAALLDELVNEVSFSDVGHQLQSAREQVRALLQAQVAVACDDPDAERRRAASQLALDTFNGKVDAIIAEARHDNFGTLEQRVRDAAAIVNRHGQAFAGARVLPAYVEARVLELKWAVAVHELKRRDREEQRALKERIREEERANEQLTRAEREASAEEERLRAAIERLSRKLTRVDAEERAQCEEKLSALNSKLAAVEYNRKEARARVQETKRGTVYVVSNVGSFGEDVFKIGFTRCLDPHEHLEQLGDGNVPFPFDVHALITADDAPALLRELERRFADARWNRVDESRAFFRVSLAELKNAVADLGSNRAIWTASAARREHRESLAFERERKSRPDASGPGFEHEASGVIELAS